MTIFRKWIKKQIVYSRHPEYRNIGHYIVIDRYDAYTDTYRVVDCTYVSGYNGRHSDITASEIYNCLLKPSGADNYGYLIYG